jgi:erythromycin esterase
LSRRISPRSVCCCGPHRLERDRTAALRQSLFIDWARTHATELVGPDGQGCADLEPLRPALSKARVIALGELIHDARELHLLRNRVVRCLAAHFGVTAVALESGFADMAPLHEALLLPAPSVLELTRQRISYGWGGIPEVQMLTESLRTYNARQPIGRRVRLYGIDLTGADGSGKFSRARRSVDELLRFLAQLDSTGARRLATKAGGGSSTAPCMRRRACIRPTRAFCA